MGLTLHAEGAVTTAARTSGLHPINVITDTHPGFATDLQPPLMVLATQADGLSYFRERVHAARYSLAGELAKLGAQITVKGERATVLGSTRLRGADVVAHDLRAGISLVLAGLVAAGGTIIDNAQMIDRGHTDLVARLTALGAHIVRDETSPTTTA
jgi:UDP-N-acetylglucosamine 1-carboxyvinyltransferase